MNARLAFLAWSAVVMTAGWRHRPAPARIRALTPLVAPVVGMPPRTLRTSFAGVVDRLGGALLRRLGRPADPDRARRLGTALVVVALALPLLPAVAVPAGSVAWALPVLSARRRRRQQLAAIAADLPDVVDLLALAMRGATVRSPKAGSVQLTKGKRSLTGTLRAASSARRRRSARTSCASRSRLAPSGAP